MWHFVGITLFAVIFSSLDAEPIKMRQYVEIASEPGDEVFYENEDVVKAFEKEIFELIEDSRLITSPMSPKGNDAARKDRILGAVFESRHPKQNFLVYSPDYATDTSNEAPHLQHPRKTPLPYTAIQYSIARSPFAEYSNREDEAVHEDQKRQQKFDPLSIEEAQIVTEVQPLVQFLDGSTAQEQVTSSPDTKLPAQTIRSTSDVENVAKVEHLKQPVQGSSNHHTHSTLETEQDAVASTDHESSALPSFTIKLDPLGFLLSLLKFIPLPALNADGRLIFGIELNKGFNFPAGAGGAPTSRRLVQITTPKKQQPQTSRTVTIG